MSIGGGYEPRFDKDWEYGRQGELWVVDLIESLKNDRVEIKRDRQYPTTGKLYVEYECMGRSGWYSSGIDATKADLWVFVLGSSESAIVVSTVLLKALVERVRRNPRFCREETDGSHPTKGVVLPLSFVLTALQDGGVV